MNRRHPSVGQLRAFTDGGGDSKFRSAITLHLQSCEECRTTINSIVDPVSHEDEAATNVPNQSLEVEIPAELVDHPIYELQRLIGQGGMGQVYLAKHRITGRLEAVKILLPHLVSREEIRKRFLREIQAAAQLDHPNICGTFNALSEGNTLGLVMEYLQGTTLHSFIKKKGPIEYDKAIAIAMQIAAGIEHAHSHGMIHRDLKPANVMLLKRANRLQVKILDFGLARIVGTETNDGLTQLGGILGTPEYMSPEQAISPTKVDVRSDLYSLGCILYFMLVGEPPFLGETSIAIIQAKIANLPPSIPETANSPDELKRLITQLLATNPDDRPQDARSVIESLRSIGNVASAKSSTPSQSVSSAISPELIELAKASRASRGRTRNQSSMWGTVITVLPTIVLFAGVYLYRDRIGSIWAGNNSVKSTSAIIVRNMPPSIDIFLNNRKAEFLRPADSPHATVSVLPGNYSVTLKRADGGVDIFSKVVDVPAQQDVFIEFDPKLLDRLQHPRKPNHRPQNTELSNTAPDRKGPPSARQPSRPPITLQELDSLRSNIKAALISRNPPEALRLLSAARGEHGEITDETIESLGLAAGSLEKYLQAKVNAVSSMTGNRSILLGKSLVSFEPKNGVEDLTVEEGKLDDSERASDNSIALEVAIVQTALEAEEDVALTLGIGIITHPMFDAANHGQLYARVSARHSESKSSVKIKEALAKLPAILRDIEIPPDAESLRTSAGTVLRRIQHSSNELQSMFFVSMDSSAVKQNCLLTSGKITKNAPARLWNIESGEHVKAGDSVGSIRAIERSQNGKILVILGGTNNPHLKVYALNLTKPRYELSDVDNVASSISLSSDGRTLAACSTGQTFFKWNLQSGSLSQKVACREPVEQGNVLSSCIRAAMDCVAVAQRNGDIHLWHTADGRTICRFMGNSNPVVNMRFNRRGELVVIRNNGEISLLDIAKETPLSSIKTGPLGVCKSAFSIESGRLLTSDWFNYVRIWDANTLECKSYFPVDASSEIVSVAVDDLGKSYSIGYNNSSLEIGKAN